MNNMMEFIFYNPTKLIFGVGSLKKLHQQQLPGRKALLLTSNKDFAFKNGAIAQTISELKKANVDYELFNKIMDNPNTQIVEEGGAFAKSHNCDFIVAVGGGSVLDSATAISVSTHNPGPIWNYIFGGSGKNQPILNPTLPIVNIATSSGTGSEINEWGVICNEACNEKISLGDPQKLKPILAIVDPYYMTSVPPLYSAFQGFDALFHNIEVFIGKDLNLLSETLALSAIEHIVSFLPRAVKNGFDLEAREHVAYGSTIAGMVMQLSLTIAKHSISHAMSAYHRKLPHGAALIMISSAFYQSIIDKNIFHDKFIKLARIMGISEASSAQDFIVALEKLQKDCNVFGLKMSDYGISPDEFPTLAFNARYTMPDFYTSNPFDISDDEVIEILKRSYL